MREHCHTTPRRRGPKQPLPLDDLYNESFELQESPYYTIDNTEDIYSTTLLPSQRCYIDPWDLENYDYVRKKIGQTPLPDEYYGSSQSPSPIEEPMRSSYYYQPEPMLMIPRMASTMPRNRRSSHYPCQMECCQSKPQMRRPSGIYDMGRSADHYDDYLMSHMARKFQNDFNLEEIEQNIYTGYSGLSSASSAEPHSSLGDDYRSLTIPRKSSGYGPVARKLSKPAPKLEFPAPPPSVPPSYDYCNPYATMPCCSVSDCYECMSQAQQQLYGAHSVYGGLNTAATHAGSCYDCGLLTSSSTLGRRPSSSLYSGIYSSKFGLSKKGLLQIDYSCSWNNLDRIMTRNY